MNNNPKPFLKGAVFENPVLFQCAGLCPAIAATSTLKNALIISAALICDMLLTSFIASSILKKVPRYIRVAFYLIIGLALICPALWLLENKTQLELDLGMKIFIPLIAVNSLTAVQCETYSVKHSVGSAVLNAFASGIGACVVIILCGIVREIVGKGTIGGYQLDMAFTLSGMAMPFGCLVFLGFLSAALKAAVGSAHSSKMREKPAPAQPTEISLDIREQILDEPEPEKVDLVLADYDDIDDILSSTDEFLKSLTGYDGGDEE